MSKKADKIILVGKELYYKYGIKRVSVEEICKEANVSKMTFYKYFSNKIVLAEEILDKVVGKLLEEFKDLVNSDKSFQEKVHGMFLIKHKAAEGISREFINDLYKNPETGLHLKMEEMSKISLNIFIQFLEDSKKENLIRKEVNIQMILEYFNHISLLLDNQQIMSEYDNVKDFIMEAMSFCFYGIMPRQD